MDPKSCFIIAFVEILSQLLGILDPTTLQYCSIPRVHCSYLFTTEFYDIYGGHSPEHKTL